MISSKSLVPCALTLALTAFWSCKDVDRDGTRDDGSDESGDDAAGEGGGGDVPGGHGGSGGGGGTGGTTRLDAAATNVDAGGGMTGAGGTVVAADAADGAGGATAGAGGSGGQAGMGMAGAGGSGPQCKAFAPCGGDVVGTWNYDVLCDLPASDPEPAPNLCPGAQRAFVTMAGKGPFTFKPDHTWVDATVLWFTYRLTVPAACLVRSDGSKLTCEQFAAMYPGKLPPRDDIESAVCRPRGDGCVCDEKGFEAPDVISGTWSVSGNVLTTRAQGGKDIVRPFCVANGEYWDGPVSDPDAPDDRSYIRFTKAAQ